MIAQNIRLDELYHAEASNLTFKNKRRAYVQTCDGEGRRKSFVAELLRDGLEFPNAILQDRSR